MIIETIDKQTFLLKRDDHKKEAMLSYNNNSFNTGFIITEKQFSLRLLATGIWLTELDIQKIIETKVGIGGIINMHFFKRKKKYIFKKSVNWKLRFCVCNYAGDEVLSLLPSVNWEKASHDFVLQLNEEFEQECDALLILQALHCANCSLSMMIGGSVPALISL